MSKLYFHFTGISLAFILTACSNDGYYISSFEFELFRDIRVNDSTLFFSDLNSRSNSGTGDTLIYFKITTNWGDNTFEPQDSILSISFYDSNSNNIINDFILENQYKVIEMNSFLEDEYTNSLYPLTDEGHISYAILTPEDIDEYISTYNKSTHLMYSKYYTVNNLIVFSKDSIPIDRIDRVEVVVYNKIRRKIYKLEKHINS